MTELREDQKKEALRRLKLLEAEELSKGLVEKFEKTGQVDVYTLDKEKMRQQNEKERKIIAQIEKNGCFVYLVLTDKGQYYQLYYVSNESKDWGEDINSVGKQSIFLIRCKDIRKRGKIVYFGHLDQPNESEIYIEV